MIHRRAEAAVFTVTLLALLFSLTAPLTAGDLTPQEQRGRQIYFEGTSPRGESLAAFIGESRTEVPASVVTCASCHGSDGRGRPEAGVIPSNITWSYLFKPYGHHDSLGRRHPAFTLESLGDAILRGVDPAGNQLDSSMPNYQMTQEDLDDLLAYLRKLETDFDPGISETALRIGTVLPTKGQAAVLGQGVFEVLTAFFDGINSAGGIHNRKLELIVQPFDNPTQSPLAAATRLMEEGDVFALLSPMVAGADREIGELAERESVPVIGPLTLVSPDPYIINDYTFYVFSGLEEQVRALVDFAADELEIVSPRVAVVGADDERSARLLEVVEEQCGVHGWSETILNEEVAADFDAAATARRLAASDVGVVIFLSSRGVGALLAEGAKLGWRPRVLLPGVFLEQELLEQASGDLKGEVYLAYPTVPTDLTQAGAGELKELLSTHGLSLRHRPAQVSALAAAKILMEGLKAAGRDLSRPRLLRALEKLYAFETGLTPPVTYGANRRIGALGAYVVRLDLSAKTFAPVGGWITPR